MIKKATTSKATPDARLGQPAAKKTTSKKGIAALKAAAGPQLDLPDGDSQDIPPSHLLLDPHNLRLLEQTRESLATVKVTLFGQPAIQSKLYELICETPRYDIDGLVNSIANNGFLKHERLIVAKYDGDKFLVLEGNRRLTAVLKIRTMHGPELSSLRPKIRQSLFALPCLVLEGPAINGSAEQLDIYRRAAEVYIGMRHLMGAKDWDPAARYEFLSRLIFTEGWSITDVVNHFGRRKGEVLRDLKAQVLYRNFLAFEKKHGFNHVPTYNAFSEAARAPSIYRWLNWSDKDIAFSNKQREETFFHYLISKAPLPSGAESPDGEESMPDPSAEVAVRRLRDMLSLGDHRVEEALEDGEFKSAEILFEERKEGELPKKLLSIIKGLKRTTTDDLQSEPDATEAALIDLADQVNKLLKLVRALR